MVKSLKGSEYGWNNDRKELQDEQKPLELRLTEKIGCVHFVTPSSLEGRD
jgi:hypothetical protein